MGEHRVAPGSSGWRGARARPRHLWRCHPQSAERPAFQAVRAFPAAKAMDGADAERGGGREGRRQAWRRNAGTLGTLPASTTCARWTVGAEGQGDRGGHGSDVIAEDAAEFAAVDP